MNEVTIYSAELALAVQNGEDYTINAPNGVKQNLQRGVDFDVIPGTKQPTLLKAGAEKVCMAYGLFPHYYIESKVERFDEGVPFCYYLIRCELVKVASNGQEYVFTMGYGSSNTMEKRNGRNGAYDSANSTIKMAQKRAMVSAALSISGLSSMFTQDMENETFMNANYQALAQTANPDAPLTNPQMKRIYALAGSIGLNAKEAKERILSSGFASVKEITQKDYDRVCALFEQKGEEK